MPRKVSATSAEGVEPRRSTRIKDQPKPDPPAKKAPVKPRAKKTKSEGDDVEAAQPARGKKRSAAEMDADDAEPNGNDKQPPVKKVRHRVARAPPRSSRIRAAKRVSNDINASPLFG